MTVMLLALFFSDAALNSSEAGTYRIDEQSEALAEPYAEPRSRTREWKPGLDGWKIERNDCPAFFSQKVEGFGVFQAGPSCADEEVPYAL